MIKALSVYINKYETIFTSLLSIKMEYIKLTVCIVFTLHYTNAFTVDVVNITLCKASNSEYGTLDTDVESEETTDQLLNAEFSLPVDLDEKTMIEYESNAWDKKKWKFLFKGKRSFCNSIVPTTAYKSFAGKVEPDFPLKCNIPAGEYKIMKFPISGQYVVLSDIKKAPEIVKHKIQLLVNDELILCRVIYTKSENK